MSDHALDRAVLAIATADALLIRAGAGTGVDCGLPDFRVTSFRLLFPRTVKWSRQEGVNGLDD